MCGKLRRLALPLGSKDSFPWYSRMMQDLPHLANDWFMGAYNYRAFDDTHLADRDKNAIPTKSNMRFFAYDLFCYSCQERKDGRPNYSIRTRFRNCEICLDANGLEKSTSIFYNRYTCFPLLPDNFGPPGCGFIEK